jgi:SAM-dependent methyltransferase
MINWDKIATMEEAKQFISNPHYKKTGEFDADEEWIDNNLDLGRKTILDFGCGLGRNAKYIVTKTDFLYCYDYPNMIKLAKEYIGSDKDRIIFIEHPIENLMGLQFDIIFADVVFQHINRDDLRKIFPVLKSCLVSNGVLVVNSRGFCDDNNYNVWSIITEFFKPITDVDINDGTIRHQTGKFI